MLVQVFFFSSGNLILDGIFACIIMAVYNFEKGLIMFSFSNWKSVFFSSNYNFFPLNLRNDFLVSSNDFFCGFDAQLVIVFFTARTRTFFEFERELKSANFNFGDQ